MLTDSVTLLLGVLLAGVGGELFVRGAVPGSRNGIVTVAKQGGKSRYA